MIYRNRKDLEFINKLISSFIGKKINKSKAKTKILNFFYDINISVDNDVKILVDHYIEHLNSNSFTVLGRRMHLLMCYISLKQGSGFLKSYKKLKGDFKDPLFVIGLPRSGTTNLHNLFIEEFGYNGLKYWQLASPSKRVDNYKLDNLLRRSQTNFIFSIFKYLLPSMQEMHHVNIDTYEECWIFQKNMFFCYNYVIQTDFQILEDYLLKKDSSFILAQYKKFLSSNRAFLEKPFALKCPEYLLFLEDINKVFPKSKIAWVHRDPYDSILSYSPMINSTWDFFRGKTKKEEVGKYIVSLYKKMLKKAIVDRKKINNNFYDISYNTLISNRDNLAINLKKKIPSFPRTVKKKNSDFYLNKHKFTSSDYKITKDEIENEFSFYYDEYGDYL